MLPSVSLPEALASRVGSAAIALVALSAIAFALPWLVGGDPAVALYGIDATAEQRLRIRSELGLDRPLPEAYVRWAVRAATGDLGRSTRTGQPALAAVSERLPATFALALAAALSGLLAGVAAGLGSALRGDSALGLAIASLAAAATAAPSFWIGLVLLYVFWFGFGLVPGGSSAGLAGEKALDPTQLVLPAVALGLREAGRVALLVRSGVREELARPYALVASAKGLSRGAVAIRHALPNALTPVVSSAGLSLSRLLGGAVAVETVFGWPGLGRLVAEAASARDLPVLSAGILVAGVGCLLVGLATDVAYLLVDPRARSGRAGEVE